MNFTDALAIAMAGRWVELDVPYGVHAMVYDERAGHLHTEFGDHLKTSPLEFTLGITREMYDSVNWEERGGGS